MVHKSRTTNDIPIHLGQVLKIHKIHGRNILNHPPFAVLIGVKLIFKIRSTQNSSMLINSIGPSIILGSIYTRNVFICS